MKDTAFLVLNRNGILHMRKSEPALESGQRALKVRLTVKDEYFKQSIPEACATIGPEHVLHPEIDFTLESAQDAETK